MTDITSAMSSEDWRSATQARIDDQIALFAGLKLGSDAHGVATSVLLMLQDSLSVLSQTKMIVDAVQRSLQALRCQYPFHSVVSTMKPKG